MIRREWDGLIVLDKPPGMTSRDAVNQIQATLPKGTKLGHTGTLDPLATGVLVLCLGRATRLAEFVQAMSKTYRSTFVLGKISDTDDADGVIQPVEGIAPLNRNEVEAGLSKFVGEILQTPPAYSAAKTGGRRAYSLARVGAEVALEPRTVRVDSISTLAYAWPRLEVEIGCGKGTYIRSIARDLGQLLGCGAYVETLRRTRVGCFQAESGLPPDASIDQLAQSLRPCADALAELPGIQVTQEEAARLRHGDFVPRSGMGQVAIFDSANDLVGVGLLDERCLRPTKILTNRE